VNPLEWLKLKELSFGKHIAIEYHGHLIMRHPFQKTCDIAQELRSTGAEWSMLQSIISKCIQLAETPDYSLLPEAK